MQVWRCGSSLLAETAPRSNSRMDSCAPRIQPSVSREDRTKKKRPNERVVGARHLAARGEVALRAPDPRSAHLP